MGEVFAATFGALDEIFEERRRQDRKWGPVQDIPDIQRGWSNFNYGIPTAQAAKDTTDKRMSMHTDTYADILLEEVCEAFEEASAGDRDALRTELIQVAAVAVKWVENIDRTASG